MKQTWEIVFGGVGGQGLLLMGNLLGSAAAIFEDRQAVMAPSYGTESRGTFTKAELVLSTEDIAFPGVLHPDVVVALAQVAYDKYAPILPQGALLLYNSNIVAPAVSAAEQEGYPMETLLRKTGAGALNMVALGILTARSGCAQIESVEQAIRQKFEDKPEAADGNCKAFYAGASAVRNKQT